MFYGETMTFVQSFGFLPSIEKCEDTQKKAQFNTSHQSSQMSRSEKSKAARE